MGLNKRIITKERIVSTPEGELPKLFNADAFVFDNWSYQFFELYTKGNSKDMIIGELI